MATSMFQRVLDTFSVKSLTSDQKDVLNNLINHRDVYLSIKTGGGKSLCYQAFPLVFEEKHGEACKVLVISPLLSIMKEQTEFLSSLGLSAAFIGCSEESDGEIRQGHIQYVYSSPESVLANEKWRTWLLSSSGFELIVIDEAHTVIHWSQSSPTGNAPFREWFGHVGELRSLLKCPVLVITATASDASRRKLKKKLALVDCHEVVDSPDRENVKLFVKKIKSNVPMSEVFEWLLKQVMELESSSPRTLVFFDSIKSCSKAYTAFRLYLSQELMIHIQMFHSDTPDDIKDKIKEDMQNVNGDVRVLLASSAAGMGVNYKAVNHIVHFGPPKDMDSFVQQLGRAGRDGTQSYQILIFHARHLGSFRPKHKHFEMKEYAENTEVCRRKLILKSYGASSSLTVAHLCCDICDKTCKCAKDYCQLHSLPFLDELSSVFEQESEPDIDSLWNSSASESETDSDN